MNTQVDKTLKVENIEVEDRADGGVEVFDPTESVVLAKPAADAQVKAGTEALDEAPPNPDEVTEIEELAAAETDADREAIRARRRQERRDKRERRRQHDASLQRELATRDTQIAELARTVNVLTQRSSGTELAQLDEEMARGDSALAELRSTIAEATRTGNGDIVADATERMMQVGLRLNDLKRVRANFVQNAQRTAKQTTTSNAPPAVFLNPEVRRLGTSWAQQNSWYNPQGVDLDSKIVKQIDDAVMQEGFDPSSQEYWDELSDRVERYLPHRAAKPPAGQNSGAGYSSERNGRKPGSSVVSGSGRENSAAVSNGAKRGSYTLSPERVTALKDAGVWDDVDKRNDAIRRYREYDKNATSRS